jgi:uncharacterized protein (DUF4415 family)
MKNEGHIVRYTPEELKQQRARGESQTDWILVEAMTDDELEASIDHNEEGEVDWDSVQVGIPPAKHQLTVRFDLDVVEWFKAQGKGYQTRMNAVLRHYVESQKK